MHGLKSLISFLRASATKHEWDLMAQSLSHFLSYFILEILYNLQIELNALKKF